MAIARRAASAAALGLLLVAGIAAPGAAQQRNETWWDWVMPVVLEGQELRTSRGQVVVVDPEKLRARVERRGERGAAGRRAGRDGHPRDFTRRGRGQPAGSPAFCRSGAGHPVHGRRWCLEKGFGLGEPLWRRGRRGGGPLEEIIFRIPGGERRRGDLERSDLVDILGEVVFGRIAEEGARTGVQGPIAGRWLEAEGGARILQLRVGSAPLAELTDLDGDGRVDVLLLNEAEPPEER